MMFSIVNEFRVLNFLPENIRPNIKSFSIPSSEEAICVTNDNKVYALGTAMIERCGYSESIDDQNFKLITELCEQSIEEFYSLGYIYSGSFMFAKSDNKIFGWGQNHYGQLGRGYVSDTNEYMKPERIGCFDNKNIVDISFGKRHCLALSQNGRVYGWGNNKIEEQDYINSISTPFLIDSGYGINESVKYIQCFKYTSILLTVNSFIYISYSNEWNFKTKITTFSDVFKVCMTSDKMTLIFQNNGQLVSIEDPTKSDDIKLLSEKVFPDPQNLLDNAIDWFTVIVNTNQGIEVVNMVEFKTTLYEKYNKVFDYFLFENQSTYKTYHLINNGIYVKNFVLKNELNHLKICESLEPIYENIDDLKEKCSELAMSQFQILNPFPRGINSKVKYYHQIGDYLLCNYSAIFVMNDNKVYGFGCNETGILGLGHSLKTKEYTKIPELCDQNIEEFFNGRNCLFARNDKNEIFGWGQNECGQLGRGYMDEFDVCLKPMKINKLKNKNIIQICCGYGHCLALSSDGSVYCWGLNDYGQTGCGSEEEFIFYPVKVEFNEKDIRIKNIYCEASSCYVVTVNGKVYHWGSDCIIDRRLRPKLFIPKLIEIENVSKFYYFDFNNLIMPVLYINGSMKLFKNDLTQSVIEITDISDILFNKPFENVILQKEDGVYEYNIGLNEVTKTYFSNFFEYRLHKQNQIESIRIEDTIKITSDGYLMTSKIQVNQNCRENLNETLLNKVWENIFDRKYQTFFRQIGVIGRGGFGYVFKVENIKKCELCVIKRIEIKKKISPLDDIMREIEIMSKLNPVYVVNYLNAWTEGKTIDNFGLMTYVYIQMELCSQNLETLIKSINSLDDRYKTIQYFIRTQLLVEIIECLNHLHSSTPPILHRDIKPENILVTEGTNVRFLKLCDFGLSKFFGSSLNTLGKGTEEYMAPEVVNIYTKPKKSDYGLKSDIYSLGVIVTKLFDFKDSIENIRKNSFLDKYLTEYPETILKEKFIKLNEMISRMVSKKSEDRPNCKELFHNMIDWTVDQNIVSTDERDTLLNSINNIENKTLRIIIRAKLNQA